MLIFFIRSKKRWEKWQNKGREKVSFVLVPHSEKVVVSLDMSFAMLLFLSFMSGLLLLLSLLFLIYFSFFWVKNEDIFQGSSQDEIAFLYYKHMSKDMKAGIKDLEKTTEELNLLAWNEVSWNQLITQDYFPEPLLEVPDYREMQTNMNLYPQTVQAYSESLLRLKKMKPVFQNAMDYLSLRESIFHNIPRGRPLGPGVGNVTSLWGQRRDPFGILPTGEFHSGIDFASGHGTPIYATAPGVIPKLEFTSGGLGRYVRVFHENGYISVYGHCSEVLVKEGDVVKRGDKIALVGRTGKATGSHVHYEVRIGLDPSMNPEEYINLE
ncbi:MAG: M23 family metallopeptidase [Leptospira sp.]|nr:M23 family metallopeptidase [Leptospira sp.]